MQESLNAKYEGIGNRIKERRGERTIFFRTEMPMEENLIIYLHIIGVKNVYLDMQDDDMRKEILSSTS